VAGIYSGECPVTGFDVGAVEIFEFCYQSLNSLLILGLGSHGNKM
jgi:hypothetical protein